MEFEVSYSLDNEQQFWDELDDIVSAHCQSHELIDNALRNYLSFTTNFKGDYLQSEYDVARCSYKLLDSTLFTSHKDYVRRQIIYGLLQEDGGDTLHLIAAFLLFDGRQNESTFEMMNDEAVFPRLLELLQSQQEDAVLHRLLLELLYEMSRIQRLRPQDLILIDDDFITSLLQIIESISDDANDPYHYPVIRVLLVLNEQYMVSAHDPDPSSTNRLVLPNKVIRTLSRHSSTFKTFGENIILLLNRESETSLQLLILKLLYLLFTTPATYEYFYTNDLRVLVDVMIRNLLDLPLSSLALRHTYLRVLYPLLAHTQLKSPENNYKREELLKLLHMMTSSSGVGMAHFGAVDETTKRLVGRVISVPWLKENNDGEQSPEPANRFLGIGMNPRAGESSLSVMEVAAHTERPGVQTPSRGLGREAGQPTTRDNREEDSGGGGVPITGHADITEDSAVELQSPFE